MLHKTGGIVINFIKYRETSIIVKIYTEKFGIQSYIVNSIRSQKSKSKMALYQPLTILDLVVYYKNNQGINRISEAKCAYPFNDIPFSPLKSGMAMFITEILSKVLKEETENLPLYHFIRNSILWLDYTQSNFNNFHLQFLLSLSQFLGFIPSSPDELFGQLQIELNPEIKTLQIDVAFKNLIGSKYDEEITFSTQTRRKVLDLLLQFYQLHIGSMGEIKSVQVLKEVLS
jgi:DNA repair protein RecO (recombination protein O)